MIGVGLGLLSALTHASWNAMSQRFADQGRVFLWGANLFALILLVPLFIWSACTSELSLGAKWVFASILGGLAHLAYMLVLQFAYRRASVSVVYPTSRGFAPVIVCIGTAILAHSLPSASSQVGIMLIAASIGSMAFIPGRGSAGIRTEALWGLAVGGTVAGYTVWDAFVVVTLRVPIIPYYFLMSVTLFFALTVFSLKHLRGLRAVSLSKRTILFAAIVGFLIPASYLSALVANLFVDVASVSALRSLSIVFAVVISWIWLRERITFVQIVACALCVVGTALLVS